MSADTFLARLVKAIRTTAVRSRRSSDTAWSEMSALADGGAKASKRAPSHGQRAMRGALDMVGRATAGGRRQPSRGRGHSAQAPVATRSLAEQRPCGGPRKHLSRRSWCMRVSRGALEPDAGRPGGDSFASASAGRRRDAVGSARVSAVVVETSNRRGRLLRRQSGTSIWDLDRPTGSRTRASADPRCRCGTACPRPHHRRSHP